MQTPVARTAASPIGVRSESCKIRFRTRALTVGCLPRRILIVGRLRLIAIAWLPALIYSVPNHVSRICGVSVIPKQLFINHSRVPNNAFPRYSNPFVHVSSECCTCRTAVALFSSSPSSPRSRTLQSAIGPVFLGLTGLSA